MSTRFRFGRVEIRADTRELRLDDKVAPLGSRAFDLLLALVERRDRTVPKAELLDIVWPNMIVEENNLQVQVSAVRRRLGNGSIATVPGRGYRFTMAADASPTAPPSVAHRPPPIPTLPEQVYGRAEELDLLFAWLEERRIVTVLGPGGIGKTTLSLAVARRRADSGEAVGWVELAPITDPSSVSQAIARALNLPMGPGESDEALVASIAPERALLVLDNAEHLIESLARIVPAIVAAAPELRVLVTSQAPLKIEGEWLFRIGALAVPSGESSVEEAKRYGAVALFEFCARAADRRFSLNADNVKRVIDLCNRLEGVPLAIRLAAARLPMFGLAGLSARIGEQLDLLAGAQPTLPSRQRTLRAAHDWSHGLLGAAEQVVFRRLGVFAGGFTPDSAAAVAGDAGLSRWNVVDALAVLVERSLVSTDDGDEPRCRLLDSARSYVLERLDAAGERILVQRRHAQRLRVLLEQSIDDERSDLPDAEWMARYVPELDDLRAALVFTCEHDHALAVELVASSRPMFRMLGQMQEAFAWARRVTIFVDEQTPLLVRARLADLRRFAGEGLQETAGTPPVLEVVRQLREAGDRVGLFLTLTDAMLDATPAVRRDCLAEMRSLVEAHWPLRLRIVERIGEGIEHSLAERHREARAVLTECVAQTRALGKTHMTSRLLVWLSTSEAILDQRSDAVAHASEAVALARSHGSSNLQLTLRMLLSVLLDAGEVQAARSAIGQCLALMRRTGWYGFPALPLRFALFAALDGRFHDASRLLGYAERVAPDFEDSMSSRNRHQADALIAASLDAATVAAERAIGVGMAQDEACTIALGSGH